MESSIESIPAHLRPKNAGTEQLFGNTVIEKLTRAHIAVPVAMHLLIVGWVAYLSLDRFSLFTFLLLFAGAWVTWTLAEYIVHRYGYHFKTRNRVWLRIQHIGHGIHHQYPKDPTRLAMPPLPAIVLASAFFGIFWLLMGEFALAFFPGFLFGYVMYISLHYAQHRFAPPKFGPLNRLWKFHALHHYKYPETRAFGVSTTLWDRVFGTMPPKSR